MGALLIKYLLTALMVIVVSEFARRSGRLGGFVAALPLVSVLTLIWLHVDHQPAARIGDYARYTFWYVLPTLPMFLLFSTLLVRFSFWPALLAGAVLTLLCFGLLALALRPLGIDLLP